MNKRFLISAFLIASLAGTLRASLVDGKASVVIGQYEFTGSVSGSGSSKFNTPIGVAVSTQNWVYVSDSANHRIMFWKDASSLYNGKLCDGYIGDSQGTTQHSVSYPYGICVDNASNLWVADRDNDRVLRFPYPQSTSMNADHILGQVDFTTTPNFSAVCSSITLSNPHSVTVDDMGRICVTDKGYNRTLIFDLPVSSWIAQQVLGHSNFNTPTTIPPSTPDTQYEPFSIGLSSSGYIVADQGYNRVLIFSTPTSNGMNANLVLGQVDFISYQPNQTFGYAGRTSLNQPSAATTKGSDTWVADTSNNRVLKYTAPLTNGASAVFLLGQTDFAAKTSSCTQTTLNAPSGVIVDHQNNLWVVDKGNHRVLRYDNFSVASVSPERVVSGLPSKRFTITGTGIPANCIVKLTQGASEIMGTDITYDSETSITCAFDFSSAATGAWDLELEYFDVTFASNKRILAGGVTVFQQRIDLVAPNRAANGSYAAVTVTGEGFPWGTKLFITKQGFTTITASPTTVSSNEKTLTGYFDLTGAVTGYWNVYVSSGNISTTLADGFFISTSTLISKEIDPYTDSVISIQGEDYGTLLRISSGTFSSPVTLRLEIPAVFPAVGQDELVSLNAFFDITNDKDIQPLQEISMTVTYTNKLASGLNRSRFRVCLYDPALNRWSPVPSNSYPDSNTIVASLNHFSMYGLFQLVPASKLGRVYVYPNPYRPDSNTIYDNPALGRGVVFASLPPNARIKIFTATGEFVREIEETTDDGNLLWDTTNSEGQRCASGVYIYLVTSQDDPGKKTTGRLAIIE